MPHERDAKPARRSPFEGASIRLRAVEESDLGWINEHIWIPEVTRFLSMAWPEPLAGTRAWFERSRSDDAVTNARDTVNFVVETLEGEIVGVTGLEGRSSRERSAVLGIWLAEPFWSRGYGTDAVRTLCGYGFREMNLHRIELHVYPFNERGVRAYARVGFREEGRLRDALFVDGRHHDVIVMGLLADEFAFEG